MLRRSDLGSRLSIEAAEGLVRVRALVRTDGSVASADVVASSGSEVLDRAAVDAVRGWRFAPARRDGVPFEAVVVLKIRYVVR